MSSLHDLITRGAEAQLAHVRNDGACPPGHNGPYHDPETPVRNTSHWLITFARVSNWTDDKRFLLAARACLGYLLSGEARPAGGGFHHRTTITKDAVNGLIGQAWAIEALVEAAVALDDETALEVATTVARLHRFYPKQGLWATTDLDGTTRGIDITFNHQLWFASVLAALSDLTGDTRLAEEVRTFGAKLGRNLHLVPQGYIRHMCPRRGSYPLRAWAGIVRNPGRERARAKDRRGKEPGYHAFNLYAFARLAQTRTAQGAFNHPRVPASMDVVHDGRLQRELENNAYGYPYNPAGFEVALALVVLEGADASVAAPWVQGQLERHWDTAASALSRSAPDETTLAARLYEAARLPDMDLKPGWD